MEWPDLSAEQLERLAARSKPRRSDFSEVALPDLPDVPGMVSEPECRYLYWLTSGHYVGAGEVVEVGSWLGRSTLHLAAGLRDAGYDDVLHCFDRFTWSQDFNPKAGLKLAEGADFLPMFERNVRPVYPKVKVSRVVIRELAWHGGPIEILFLDAPKRLPDISATLSAFAGALVPDLSIVVMQDYLHFPSYALAAVVSRLGSELELVHEVENASTVAFRVRKPLEVRFFQPTEWNFRTWTAQRAKELWQQVLKPLGPGGRARLEPGLGMLLYDLGSTQAAVEYVRSLTYTDEVRKQWQHFAESSLYPRYRPLFDAVGIRPRHELVATSGTVRATAMRQSHKAQPRKKVGRYLRKKLRRMWRAPYLKSRSLGRRFLEMVGIWEPRPATSPPRKM